ncbi:MAG: TrkA family potassium uptake protein [Candidatus Saganbacteria bacterium]|nr:TrkA family potassium uptake protein [Candidatus Saganbacteria bacterium]
MKKQFAVLGIGRFGSKVARELFYRGQEVIVMDKDEHKIQQVRDEVTHAYIGDITDEAALKEAGINDCDIAIISESSNIESNLIACQICKSFGIKKVIAKAQNTLHGKILVKLQVDQIVYPEQDTAIKLVNKMTSDRILDYIELGEHINIVSVEAPAKMENLTIRELALRRRFHVTILGIKRGEELIFNLTDDNIIEKGDILVVFGETENLKKLNMDVTHKT